MTETYITIACITVAAYSIFMFGALHRQTVRADRAEAALARVEEVIMLTDAK